MQAGSGARWLVLLTGLLAAILLPWALVGDDLARWTLAATAALADRPWLVMALVVLLLALDPVLPVPSSIVAVAGGSALGAGVGAAAIFMGLMTGALIGYWLGRQPGRALAGRLVGDAALAGLDPRVRPIGPLALLLSRPVPVVAEAVVILAGAARLPWRPFLLAVVPANAALALAWAGLGATASAGHLMPALVGIIALPALAYALWHLFRRA
ncbi:VTT domain-containing protein [Sandarakinorhabdus sp. AAP62]|uniref:VTT domain-containing protein n=1 Tax=Sandarakinorhabdus sp. AAP62 TaxID=1248916 RepID=UPI0012671BA3|nr:VTT domain-containing protein [Sandarakinorhabdus sp. AAP62]